MDFEEKILIAECLELYLSTQELLNRCVDIKKAWEHHKKENDEESLLQLEFCLDCISDKVLNTINELKNAPLEILNDYLLSEEA